jgi:hypothetical protein
MTESATAIAKDDYRTQRARLERILVELAPNARIEFHPDIPPTWIKFRVVDKSTGTILAASSGDWHVTEMADKTDDWLRGFIVQLGAGRI